MAETLPRTTEDERFVAEVVRSEIEVRRVRRHFGEWHAGETA